MKMYIPHYNIYGTRPGDLVLIRIFIYNYNMYNKRYLVRGKYTALNWVRWKHAHRRFLVDSEPWNTHFPVTLTGCARNRNV